MEQYCNEYGHTGVSSRSYFQFLGYMFPEVKLLDHKLILLLIPEEWPSCFTQNYPV